MNRNDNFDLPGICIYRAPRGEGRDHAAILPERPRLPNGRYASEFSWYFKAILPQLDTYHWLIDLSDGFAHLWEDWPEARRAADLLGLGPDDDDADDAPRPPEAQFIHKPRLMTQVAPFVRDDWNNLYGFERIPADAARVVDLWQRHERSGAFLSQVDLIFQNWDAAFWTFYTNDNALIEKVIHDLERDATVRVDVQSYQETLAKCEGAQRDEQRRLGGSARDR